MIRNRYMLLKHGNHVKMVDIDDVAVFVKWRGYEYIDCSEGITKSITILSPTSEQADIVLDFIVFLLEHLPEWATKVVISKRDRVVLITTEMDGIYIDALCQLIDKQCIDGTFTINTYPSSNDVIVRGDCTPFEINDNDVYGNNVYGEE